LNIDTVLESAAQAAVSAGVEIIKKEREKKKELLEFSAKAAGYQVDKHRDDEKGGCYVWENGIIRYWNPIDNDADAFHLSVKLEISIFHHHHGIGWVDARAYSQSICCKELIGADAYASTRLSIVRAAAAIGLHALLDARIECYSNES
jgi:hypothetical protein